MKKTWILLLALLMTLSLAACGGGEKAGSEKTPDAPPQEPPAAAEVQSEAPAAEVQPEEPESAPPAEAVIPTGTKTMAWFMEYAAGGSYTMESRVEADGMSTVSLNVYDGDRIYTEAEMDGMKSISILMDGAMYILDPASKTCMKMGLEMTGVQEIIADEAAAYETAVSTGEMEVNGITCFYEEFSVEGESVQYCFNGDDLKFIRMEMEGSPYMMEILRMEKGADASLFEIPADYTVMDISSLGG